MPDLERVNRNKEGILSSMRLNGPSLPVQIARAVGLSPLFASAFLAELAAEKKIKISDMKVGSSPLYYLSGQEEQLEKFIEYLNQREKEAFFLLQKSRVLEDEKQNPVVRVALRAIKDFAVPIRIKFGGETRLFWKYFSLSDAEVGGFVRRGAERKPESLASRQPVIGGEALVSKKVHVPAQIKQKTGVGQTNISKSVVPKFKPKISSEFTKSVRDYLKGREIEVLNVLSEKKKEFVARVRLDMVFGKQEFYLIAKDKKSVTDNDLALGWQASHGEKLPALVMSSGELSKKGKDYLEKWGNLVRYEKLKF
jgi:hypothetical protein